MKVKVYPSKAQGFIHSNISKSDAHRALISAALAKGESHIYFHGSSKDIEATIQVLQTLGAKIELKENEVVVYGTDPSEVKSCSVFCNESGSTLRFMIPVFALGKGEYIFTGKGRLMERPQDVYQRFFELNGLDFVQKDGEIRLNGSIHSGEYYLDGSISSQFFTGLLFALPLCDGDSTIHISDPFESQSYIRMTIKVLKAFGIEAKLDDHTLYIPGNQTYSPADYMVEGDYSSAAFFSLLGAVNGPVGMDHLAKDTLQGDRVFFDFIQNAGALVEQKEDKYFVSPSQLNYIEVDLADCPDLGPAAIILGCLSGKGMKLKNIARLRYKESDRIAVMKQEIEKLGYVMRDEENEAIILPERNKIEQSVIEVDSHNDHRIAMALAIAATVNEVPVIIDTAQAVSKSYPQFYEDLKQVNVSLEVLDD